MFKLLAFPYRYPILVAAAVVFSLALIANYYQNAFGSGVPPISARVTRLFTKTKTICVGRFLIDVPQESKVVYGPTSLPWSITSYPGKGDSMDTLIAERLGELDAEKAWASGPLSDSDTFVGKMINGTMPSQKIIFGVSKGSSRIYRIDSYVKLNGDLFIQQADPISEHQDSYKSWPAIYSTIYSLLRIASTMKWSS